MNVPQLGGTSRFQFAIVEKSEPHVRPPVPGLLDGPVDQAPGISLIPKMPLRNLIHRPLVVVRLKQVPVAVRRDLKAPMAGEGLDRFRRRSRLGPCGDGGDEC